METSDDSAKRVGAAQRRSCSEPAERRRPSGRRACRGYEERLAVDLRALFFAAVLPLDFLADVLPAEGFFAAVFRAPVFFAAVVFLAEDFFAAAFLAGTLPPSLRASERPIAIA